MGLFGSKETPKYDQPVEVAEQKVEKIVEPPKTILGKGITFVGDFTTDEVIELYGTVKGNITSSTKVIIEPSGEQNGKINAQSLVISGHVDVEANVSECTTITPNGIFEGRLETNLFVAEPGSAFNGVLVLSPEKIPSKPGKEVQSAPAKDEAVDVPFTGFVKADAEATKSDADAEFKELVGE